MSTVRIGTTANLPPAAGVADGIVERYWKLYVHPFRQSPDPAFVHESETFREVLARILFDVVEVGGGLTLVTGEPGTGITTVLRTVASALPETAFDVAFVVDPARSVTALLGTILVELGARKLPRSRSGLMDLATSMLASMGKHGREAVVLVDEAHLLGSAQLEAIRRLMNIEANERKLLHIVLAGQPKLLMAVRRNESLDRRVTMRARLEPLGTVDGDRYLAHRVRVAGAERDPFSPAAAATIVRLAGGNARRINAIAASALVAGAKARAVTITPAIVRAAALDGEETS